MNTCTSIALACVACAALGVASAEPIFNGRGVAAQTAEGGLAAHSSRTALGSRGAATGQRGLVADGQGNVDGSAGSGFTTAAGGQGLRSGRFERSADGSVSATGEASATGRHGGTAQRSGSYTRNADGTATGERSTSLTNAHTGVSYDGSATYTKGSGFSRSGSCTDAAGNTVSCGRR